MFYEGRFNAMFQENFMYYMILLYVYGKTYILLCDLKERIHLSQVVILY